MPDVGFVNRRFISLFRYWLSIYFLLGRRAVSVRFGQFGITAVVFFQKFPLSYGAAWVVAVVALTGLFKAAEFPEVFGQAAVVIEPALSNDAPVIVVPVRYCGADTAARPPVSMVVPDKACRQVRIVIVVAGPVKVPVCEVKGRQVNDDDGAPWPVVEAPVIPVGVRPPTGIGIPVRIAEPIGVVIIIVLYYIPIGLALVINVVFRVIVIFIIIAVFAGKVLSGSF